jgi:hypothetical protein
MCVAPQMRHVSSRWPPSTFPVAFHGHPDFLMWQMHGLPPASVLSFPTLRLLFESDASARRHDHAPNACERGIR